jgi:hypothetical protein
MIEIRVSIQNRNSAKRMILGVRRSAFGLLPASDFVKGYRVTPVLPRRQAPRRRVFAVVSHIPGKCKFVYLCQELMAVVNGGRVGRESMKRGRRGRRGRGDRRENKQYELCVDAVVVVTVMAKRAH